MNISVSPTFTTDSANYEVITEGVKWTVGVHGMTCEIGLRDGGGTKYILDALTATKQEKTHIAIDPFGNIEYLGTDTEMVRPGYTNEMGDSCLFNLYLYCQINKTNFLFFNMEDREFFTRFADGIPLYSGVKTLETDYSFVHFDGPHNVIDIKNEIDFFDLRTPHGAVFVFDDVSYYDHGAVHQYLLDRHWEVLAQTPSKWSYFKS